MVDLVTLRWMRGVEFAPIRLRTAPSLLAQAHLIATPVDRNAGVAALGIGHHAVERSRLPAAMHFENRGKFRAAFWEGVEPGDN